MPATKRTVIGVGAVVSAFLSTVPAAAGPRNDVLGGLRAHGLPGEHRAGDASGGDFGRATLTAFASLPAGTLVPGSEPSGARIGKGPINGVIPPFAAQPVQGFSSAARRPGGTLDVLSDNGYGAKANSADFLLRIQHLRPDFRTGTMRVLGGVDLGDPDGRVPFPLTRADRRLTGADFDVESMVVGLDGSYWLGDEFGPFLLHFSSAGRLLDAPVPLPGVKSPEHPGLGGARPNLARSKGLEGMARGVNGRVLYPILEGTVEGDAPGTLRIHEFDLRRRAYTERRWSYRLEDPGNAIGDMIAVDRHRFLVIERDGLQGEAARFKRIYLIDTRDGDHDGLVDKTQVADLLDLADPHGSGKTFRFPFQTIEGLVILDDRTLGVLNDNNFPFSSGRTPGRPDDNEFITVRLSRPLDADPRVHH